jgi:mannose-6-phosphate isomerase-like protein (cupin superfamily)
MNSNATPPLYPFLNSSAPDHQYIDISSASRWFDTLMIGNLRPGQSDGLRTFSAAAEDKPTEVWYIMVEGDATLVLPDGRSEVLRPYDGVYFAPGSAAELRATHSACTWLVIPSAGGSGTGLRKKGSKTIATGENSNFKSATVFKRREIAPRQWPANTLGASAKPWWFYTVTEQSRWFHSACVSCIGPGGSSTFHSHMERFEGPYETFYIALKGTALIRGEYQDYLFEGPGPAGVYVPANSAHQIINNGEDLLWYLTISSRGGTPLLVDVYNTPSGADRPGYLEEYNRIIASRRARSLPVP